MDANEMNEREQELTDKIAFFESICAQFRDMKYLRAQYMEEDRVAGRVPSWKNPVREKKFSQLDNLTPKERYAPALTDEMAEYYYKLMPPKQWITLHQFASITRTEVKHCRRILFWLGNRRFTSHNAALSLYRRRDGKDKGSFKIVSQFTQDMAVQYRGVTLRDE